MTQNIEQRTLAAVNQYENASKTAHDLTNTDSIIDTTGGQVKSLPKVAKEWDQERKDLSIKSKPVLAWANGETETNINQQRRFTDGHTYLPKSVPALMNAEPDKNWIPYSASMFNVYESTAAQLGFVFVANWSNGIIIPANSLSNKKCYWSDNLGCFITPATNTSFTTTADWNTDSINWTSVKTESYSKIDVIFEGDSITAGNTIDNYKYSATFSKMPWFAKHGRNIYNFAIGGSVVCENPYDPAAAYLPSRYLTQIYPHRPVKNGGDGAETVYLFLLIGTNDLDRRYGRKTASEVIAAINAYTSRASDDGFTVVLQTILPRKITGQEHYGVTEEQYRSEVNEAIKRKSIWSHIWSDTATCIGDTSNNAIYQDDVHPTRFGSNMIAYYLNSLMQSGASQSAMVLESQKFEGIFDSCGKTAFGVGSQYCKTSLGTKLNNLDVGFLHIQNFNSIGVDSSNWFFESGLKENRVSVVPIKDDGKGGGTPAMSWNRKGLRAWTEFGTTKTRISLCDPFNDENNGKLVIENLNPNIVGAPNDDRIWALEAADTIERGESIVLNMYDDKGQNPSPAVEFERVGKLLKSMSVYGAIKTGSANLPSADWALGGLVDNQDGTSHVEIEINGQLVKLSVVK